MKVYIKIPVERDKVNDKDILFLSGEFYKEIDLSELMEEFLDWKNTLFKYSYHSSKDLVNGFLRNKGYIQL